MTTRHTPVLIVGAGAAGLATAALLAKHGVGSLVVEKRREVFRYPKARNLSFRTLEVLRGLGLAREVHAAGAATPDMVVKRALNSAEELPAIDLAAIFAGLEGLSPEPVIQYCPQSRLEPILVRHIRNHRGEVRYGTQLAAVDQDASGVSSVLRDVDSGETTSIRSDYLVAADGVHSHLRDILGISTSGGGALPIYVVFIYFRGPWQRFVQHLGDGASVQVKNPEVDGIFVPADGDLCVFITTYFPHHGQSAAEFTEQRCRNLILAAVGEPIEIEIIDIAPWQPHQRVADSFARGRTFFVGDSAHAMPPFRAGGANVAIQSADNLAWKLAAVLRGQAGPGLLATYHDERHPVGAFSSRQSLTGPIVELLDIGSNPGLETDAEQPMFALLAGYQYRSAAVISDTTPAGASPALVTELRGQAGTRIPHVWLQDGRVSTLDLVGTGFTLLTAENRGTWASAASESIAVQTISAEDTAAWLSATGLSPSGALLVRPDSFVAWRADSLPPDPAGELTRALQTLLAC
ncbi:FAD-dependent monooxygenase [Mycolicibacterium sp. CBMA 226]|uniref:FAD-dependent monooxygenase n=1 Tax=Mycolicibacterium sp. CBMA 226 TaxID=2606611 RepID=UPI0012DEF367|nr:FAD-dependent monooxygenase [Mycolicibacterium sp. CBMA 226]MUL78166.1 NAD(P)-binding protein [Mycolicibacterium sp. CBMA 226]